MYDFIFVSFQHWWQKQLTYFIPRQTRNTCLYSALDDAKYKGCMKSVKNIWHLRPAVGPWSVQHSIARSITLFILKFDYQLTNTSWTNHLIILHPYMFEREHFKLQQSIKQMVQIAVQQWRIWHIMRQQWKGPELEVVLWAELLHEQEVFLTVGKTTSEQSGVVWLHRLHKTPQEKP